MSAFRWSAMRAILMLPYCEEQPQDGVGKPHIWRDRTAEARTRAMSTFSTGVAGNWTHVCPLTSLMPDRWNTGRTCELSLNPFKWRSAERLQSDRVSTRFHCDSSVCHSFPVRLFEHKVSLWQFCLSQRCIQTVRTQGFLLTVPSQGSINLTIMLQLDRILSQNFRSVNVCHSILFWKFCDHVLFPFWKFCQKI